MIKRVSTVICLLAVSLLWPGQVPAQTPSPEALAAAKELIIASKAAEQVKTLVPILMQQMKPAIVQNRPQVARAYDEIIPVIVEAMNSKLDVFMDASAIVYANQFTAAEMREIAVFYRTPVGQKLIEKLPVVMQQSMQLGQKFAESLLPELQDKIRQELKKRGHDI